MFLSAFSVLQSAWLSFLFFIFDKIFMAIVVAIVTTFVEGLSPKGLANLTVPIFGALTFLLLNGNI